MAVAAPFLWGSSGQPLTVEEAKARREEAAKIIANATAGKPIQHMTQGFAGVAQAMMAALDAKEATAGEAAGRELDSKNLQGVVSALTGGISAPAAPGLTAPGRGADAGGVSPATPSFVGAQPGGPTAAFRPVSGDLAARKQAIVDGLVKRGLTPNAAAAYAGNFAVENNADPIGGVGDAGTAFGLAQWRHERFDALKQLAATKGKDWRDLDVQLDHVLSEHNAMPDGYRSTLASADPAAGADLVMRKYERPSNKAMADTGAKRAAYAAQAFSRFGSAGTPAAVVAAAPDAPTTPAEPFAAAAQDAAQSAQTGAPRMVLSPQNPAVAPGTPLQQPVQLAGGGTSDMPVPGIGQAVRQNMPASQFLVQQQAQRGQTAAPPPAPSQQVAQALSAPPPAPPAAGNSREIIAKSVAAMNSPYASAGTKAVAAAIMQKALSAESPSYQRVESGGREGLFNPKTGQTQWTGAVPLNEKDRAEVIGTKLSNEEKARRLSETKMDHLTGPDGKLYERPAGTDAPWKVAPEIGSKPSEEASTLRKEIQQLPSYKNIAQAVPIYRSMVDTAGRNTKASDLNLVYGLGKIFDPTSVVREGEMVMVKNTASLPEWLNGAISQLNGGSALTPETRRQIMTEAHGRMQGYQQQFQMDSEQYGGIADRTKLNRADIIPNFGEIKQWLPNVVTVKTPDEAKALPAGTRFRAPDGREFVR